MLSHSQLVDLPGAPRFFLIDKLAGSYDVLGITPYPCKKYATPKELPFDLSHQVVRILGYPEKRPYLRAHEVASPRLVKSSLFRNASFGSINPYPGNPGLMQGRLTNKAGWAAHQLCAGVTYAVL